MTNLRLQKILYYIQGEHYREYGTPFFEGDFYAWQYGSVNIETYKEFKKFGFLPIKIDKKDDQYLLLQEEQSHPKFSEECTNFIDKVINKYRKYTTKELVDKTHKEDPWKNTYEPRMSWKIIKENNIK